MLGIGWRPHLGVVVEVEIDIARPTARRRRDRTPGPARFAARGPALDSCRPCGESDLVITALVKALCAMKPDIDEIGRHLLEAWPCRRVRDDEGDASATQAVNEARYCEALMPGLDGMADRPPGPRLQAATLRNPPIVPPSELRCRDGVARQKGEKALQPFRREAQALGQLPENGSELRPEREHAGGEEIGQGHFGIAKLLHMGNEAAALEREDEARRGLGAPAAKDGR